MGEEGEIVEGEWSREKWWRGGERWWRAEMVEGRNGGWDSVVWFRKCVCMQWGTEGCGDGRGCGEG